MRTWNTRRIAGLASMLLCAMQANATLMIEDWKASADGLITKDTISGLEWLNFSQTTIGHQAVRDEIHGTYAGFRFATTAELFGLFMNYVPGLDPSGFMFGADSQISSDLQYVMDALGYDDDTFLFVNTCAYADGCDPIGSGAGNGTGRHILRADPDTTEYAVWFGNDADYVNVQALVRIPDPASIGLFALGLVGFALRRNRHDIGHCSESA